jgi:hypothetical protein
MINIPTSFYDFASGAHQDSDQYGNELSNLVKGCLNFVANKDYDELAAFIKLLLTQKTRKNTTMTYKTIHQNLRSVLNHHWDPIGVSSEIDDEYDFYVNDIKNLLQKKASVEQIAHYLVSIEEDRMGLIPNPKRAELVANILKNTVSPAT